MMTTIQEFYDQKAALEPSKKNTLQFNIETAVLDQHSSNENIAGNTASPAISPKMGSNPKKFEMTSPKLGAFTRSP